MKAFRPFALALGLLLAAVPARAQTESPAASASKHFQRAVELYTDGDFRGALVEFKKAYTLLPRAAVLYDIGQTEYQLQEYAPALRTLEQFLAETGPNAAHRPEVQETVQILRGRVGKIALTTDRPGCDVSIDDQPSGTTPLAEPILVSIGRRRVAVLCSGWQRVAQEVDVSAGETVPVALKVGPAPAAAVSAAAVSNLSAPVDPFSRRTSRRTVITSWAITAGLLGATAAVYTAAILQSNKVDDLRRSYPVTADAFDDKLRVASRLALTGDILAVATVAAAGLSTYLSLTSREEPALQVGLLATPAGAAVTLHRNF
jgi:tetratricopeptide (TPR) repeat protein